MSKLVVALEERTREEQAPTLRGHPAPRTEDSKETRTRTGTLRKRILKDAKQASRGYIVAFTVPAGGE